MATGNELYSFRLNEFGCNNGLVDTIPFKPVGGSTVLRGLPFPNHASANTPARTYSAIGRISDRLGASANVVVTFQVVADPADPATGGVAARFTASIKKLASGTDNLTTTGAGTAVSADVTLDATAGEVVLASITLTNAEADALAANDYFRLDLSRATTHANDVYTGNVLVVGPVTVREA